MHHLYRSKISFTVICLLFFIAANAQFESSSNLPEHDGKLYYFGILLGTNQSYHKLTYRPEFRDPSSRIGTIEADKGGLGGFQLGLHVNLQLSRHFDLRFYPFNLIFSRQTLSIVEDRDSTNRIKEFNLGATTMSFPLQVRFKSDRINNFRVYTLAGIKFDRLLNPTGYNEEISNLKFSKSDFGVETGLGFQIFMPYFILSPELKFSYGLNNIHQRDPSQTYSKLIDRMSNRMISFSLHFEGGILGRN